MNSAAAQTQPVPFKTSDLLKKVLPNGLTLLVGERHHISSVSIEISTLAGSRFESGELAGVAALTSALLTEGTTRRTSEEIAVAIESVGGSLDSGAGTEGSVISATTLAKDVDLGLELCADVLLHPAFDKERVQLEREKTLAEIRSAEDRPRSVLDRKFNELIYQTHPLHRPAIGYEETVSKLARTEVHTFYQQFFVPGNCCVAVVGDFGGEKMVQKLEGMFGDWPGSAPTFPSIPSIERQDAPVNEFVPMKKEQVNLYVGHLGIRRSDPDYYALNVLDVILGSAPGFTSRIPKRLRDEQGLAYSTYANITQSAGLDPGRFVAYVGTSPGNRQRALDGIMREILTIVEEPVRADELRDATQYLTGSFVFHFQTNAQIAHFMILAERYGLGFDYVERFPALVNTVTVDEIARVAKTHLHPEAATVVVVGPEK